MPDLFVQFSRDSHFQANIFIRQANVRLTVIINSPSAFDMYLTYLLNRVYRTQVTIMLVDS